MQRALVFLSAARDRSPCCGAGSHGRLTFSVELQKEIRLVSHGVRAIPLWQSYMWIDLRRRCGPPRATCRANLRQGKATRAFNDGAGRSWQGRFVL